jgi:hypothetical protein
MEKQIREIIAQHVGGTYEAKQKCAEEVLHLFNVVGRSEQLKAYTRWLRQNDHLKSAPFPSVLNQYLKSI